MKQKGRGHKTESLDMMLSLYDDIENRIARFMTMEQWQLFCGTHLQFRGRLHRAYEEERRGPLEPWELEKESRSLILDRNRTIGTDLLLPLDHKEIEVDVRTVKRHKLKIYFARLWGELAVKVLLSSMTEIPVGIGAADRAEDRYVAMLDADPFAPKARAETPFSSESSQCDEPLSAELSYLATEITPGGHLRPRSLTW